MPRSAVHTTSCKGLIDHVAAGTVDAIYTDPPYPGKFLPCYDELAEFAVHALKPGGLLLAMSGHMYLPDILRRLGVDGLTYRWQIAYVYQRPRQNIHSAKVSVGYKPVIVFVRDGGRRPDFYSQDTIFVPPKVGSDKANHEWGQNFKGVYMLAREWLRAGWLVADPFCGAGAMLLAAKRLGCNVVGCDIDVDHVRSTESALRADLFDLECGATSP